MFRNSEDSSSETAEGLLSGISNFHMPITNTLPNNTNNVHKQYRIMWILTYILMDIFILPIISFISVLLGWIFTTLSSNISTVSIIIWIFFISVILQSIIFGLFMICKKHTAKKKKWLRIRIMISILEYLILLFVGELVLSAWYPNLSIFPNTYSYDALTEGEYINVYQNYYSISETFFDCNLDLSMVKVRHMRDSPFTFRNCNDKKNNYVSYVFTDTVHFECIPPEKMIDDDFFIMLLTYIWQFNHGVWYGMDGLNRMIDWIFPDPNTNHYDSGGLEQAWLEGKDFLDLKTYQQAYIIYIYYNSVYERNYTQYIAENYYWVQEYAKQYVLKSC